VWGWGCALLTFDIPQTALVATLDTYDFKISILGMLSVAALSLCATRVYLVATF
jgi:hypothetical protein